MDCCRAGVAVAATKSISARLTSLLFGNAVEYMQTSTEKMKNIIYRYVINVAGTEGKAAEFSRCFDFLTI